MSEPVLNRVKCQENHYSIVVSSLDRREMMEKLIKFGLLKTDIPSSITFKETRNTNTALSHYRVFG